MKKKITSGTLWINFAHYYGQIIAKIYLSKENKSQSRDSRRCTGNERFWLLNWPSIPHTTPSPRDNVRWPSYPFKFSLFLKGCYLAEDKISRRRQTLSFHFSITQINLSTALFIFIITRLFAVPVGISEVRTICKAAVIQYNLMSWAFHCIPIHPLSLPLLFIKLFTNWLSSSDKYQLTSMTFTLAFPFIPGLF